MRYYSYGPLVLERGDDGLLNFDRYDRSTLWDDANLLLEYGLADACGCYVFAIRTGRSTKPWYVGKAEKQSFKNECMTADKIGKYNRALETAGKGTPLLYFYARTTFERHAWSKPSKSRHRDIAFLETMLIGLALKKNKALVNVVDTSLLRSMIVPGLLNTPRGGLRSAAKEMRSVMGY